MSSAREIFTRGLIFGGACDGMPAHMNFETTRGDGVDVMECGGIRVQILRRGAEMFGLELDGQGFLHRDGDPSPPASGWANHATVMGYFLHRLWKEESNYRGAVVRGGNHGFLRHFDFDEPERLADGLVYRVPADRIPPDAYPLRVSLELSYRIIAGALRVQFSFLNEEPDLVAHVSFGLHPGFAVTRISEAKILLPAGRYVRHFAPGNFLDGRTELLEYSGGGFPYPIDELPGSFLVGIEGVPDRKFILEDSGRSLEFDFSEVPYVTFWSDAENFVCIEPCWGLPDSNPPVAFENKLGIQSILPGTRLTRGFSLRPSL